MWDGERQREERAFHDRQAGERARVLQRDDLRFTDASYLEHETWIAPAFARLGDLHRRNVLDLGCGHGMAAVVLARHGAHVTACDLSPGYVREAQARAEVNGVAVDFVVCGGEALPFAADVFDAVWGNAILHHLDLPRALRELRRVLKPGGVAVFCEPWGENRALELARRHLPYPGKQRTRDEIPLRLRDLRIMRTIFPRLEVQGAQLVSMARRLVKNARLAHALTGGDGWLLQRYSFLQRYCRYVVLTLKND